MTPLLRFTGSLDALGAEERRRLTERESESDDRTRRTTADIVERVRRGGDGALRELALELDRVSVASLEVPRERRREALENLEPELRRALVRAAENIATAHRALLPRTIEIETEPGVHLWRRPDPLARVGVYAPGGRAAYPSSVLMGAIPARVAGVGEIVLCSPPGAGGVPSALVLGAAEIAGVDRVFAIGGAGAIAAMAYGTESVPRVDRIVGPGNAYVAAAKLRVVDRVSIDAPAGPSELLVLADEGADAHAVARELMAQAEHDPEACVVAITVGERMARVIEAALEQALPSQGRHEIIAASLLARGAVLSTATLDQAIAFSNDYAPEHLLLAVADPEAAAARVRNAGAVFLGLSSSVAFGDYLTGANHTLPTGGAARAYSGLSTLDFVRWTSLQRVTPEAAARLAADVATLAAAERLPAHAAAAGAWGASG